MNALHESLATLFAELIDGPSPRAAYVLNGGDQGLLRSLDMLSAEAASSVPMGGAASIAAHVDHVCYGLELMLRWSEGEPDPWSDADWTASWRRTRVSDAEWRRLRSHLATTVRRWHAALSKPRDLSTIELNGVVASVAHLAYHFGAIRQLDRSIQGPRATP